MSSYFLLVLLTLSLFYGVHSHVEDLCFGRADPGSKGGSGIYNFYQTGLDAGCEYGEVSQQCYQAVFADSRHTFNDTSICRGMLHFMNIYMLAVAAGFKQEPAYFMAAYSQAIDYNQYRAVDSCGRDMPARFWTPRMRGLSRLNTFEGGTHRHLGIPFAGWIDQDPLAPEVLIGPGPPLNQAIKNYTGNSPNGCKAYDFLESYEDYLPNCPALRIDLTDRYYEGSLWHGKRWAFDESDTLCVGGYTKIDTRSDSPFVGENCLEARIQKLVNVDLQVIQGPIPLNNFYFISGVQEIDYDCVPDCSTPNYTKQNIVLASRFKSWLAEQSKVNGYAKFENGEPVDPVLAKFGIYLHWISDRTSHWYCTDASQSGHIAVRDPQNPGEYNLYMYLENSECNFFTHLMTHYWEQGLSGLYAHASYAALVYQYQEILAFRWKYIRIKPEWFDKPNKPPMGEKRIIGDYKHKGDLFEINQIEDANKRYQAVVDWLDKHHYPQMPGYKEKC